MEAGSSYSMTMERVLPAEAGAAADQGDGRESFERLLQPLLDAGFGLAFAMLRDRTAAEDAVQEAAYKAWRGRGAVDRPEAALRGWFLTIVANQCRDARRARWHGVLRIGSRPSGVHADHADQVVRDLELDRAMARLAPVTRALVYLRYAQDMAPSDIARVTGLRPGTVKSRLHRGLRRLETYLEQDT